MSKKNLSTLYVNIPHKHPLKILSEVIIFVFKSIFRKRIGFSETSPYWTSKRKRAERKYLNELLTIE